MRGALGSGSGQTLRWCVGAKDPRTPGPSRTEPPPRAANLNPGRLEILASPIITPHHDDSAGAPLAGLARIAGPSSLSLTPHRPSPAFPLAPYPASLTRSPVPSLPPAQLQNRLPPATPASAPAPTHAATPPHLPHPAVPCAVPACQIARHLTALTGRLRPSPCPYSAYPTQPNPTLPPLTHHHWPSIADSTPHSTTRIPPHALSVTHLSLSSFSTSTSLVSLSLTLYSPPIHLYTNPQLIITQHVSSEALPDVAIHPRPHLSLDSWMDRLQDCTIRWQI